MAKLPIVKSDIITPYTFNSTELASIVITGNNKTMPIRRGGHVYEGTLGIKPQNMLQTPDKFWEIVAFLTTYPTFEIPMYNLSKTSTMLVFGTVTTTSAVTVGTRQIEVSVSGGWPNNSARLVPGQYLKFTGHNKLYQCLSHVGTTLKLMQPFQATVGTGVAVTIAQYDFANVLFSGQLMTVVNMDYGNPISRIEDGLMGYIGPLTLKEKL